MPNNENKSTENSELYATWKDCFKLLRPAFLFSMLVNMLMLTGPLFMLQVYDRVLTSRSVETLLALFFLVVVLYVFMGILDYSRGRVLARIGTNIQSTLEKRVFNAALIRSLFPIESVPASSGTRNLGLIQNFFSTSAFPAIMDIPWTPLFLLAIFLFHPVLGWVAVLGSILLIILTVINQRVTQDAVLEAQRKSTIAQNFAEVTQESSELVRSQGMTDVMIERWLAMRREAVSSGMEAGDWTGLFSAFTKSFRLLLQSTMLAVGAYFTIQGEVTAGAIIAGSILLGRALGPVEQLLGQWKSIQLTVESWRSLDSLLKTVPIEKDRVELPPPPPVLAISSLTFVPRGSDKPILMNLNFVLNSGDILGVIGPSGAGKSTLAKLLLGLRVPTHGEVRLGASTLDQYNASEIASYIGYLPQTITLFAGSIAENISRMSLNIDESKVVRAAQLAKAHELITALPNGYNTPVGPNGFDLSGGQTQRIALARALYNDPLILLLDEPTSALDDEGTQALNEVAKSYQQAGRSAIIMTHRPSSIVSCNKLLVLKEGRAIGFGDRDKVLNALTKNAKNINREMASKI